MIYDLIKKGKLKLKTNKKKLFQSVRRHILIVMFPSFLLFFKYKSVIQVARIFIFIFLFVSHHFFFLDLNLIFFILFNAMAV